MAPLWTKKRGLEINGVVHALQGNGPGVPGLFLAGATWCRCRVPKSAKETGRGCTCAKCKEKRTYWKKKNVPK